MNHGIAIDEFDSGHDAILEFLFGCDTDMAQDRTRELGEEALDEVEPRPVLGRECELKAAVRLGCEPGLGLSRDMGRMIIEDQVDYRRDRIGGIEELEEFDELAAAIATSDQGWTSPLSRSMPASRLTVAVAFIRSSL